MFSERSANGPIGLEPTSRSIGACPFYWFHVIAVGLLATVLVVFQSVKTHAATTVPPQWIDKALMTTSLFETGVADGWGMVTPDRDCQGMSLGIIQRTVANGSVKAVFARMDPPRLAAIIRETMPQFGTQFQSLLAADNREALRIARSWQAPDFDQQQERQCLQGRRQAEFKKDSERIDPRGQTQRYSKVEEELGALLRHTDVRQAQRNESSGNATCALRLAELWAWRVAHPEANPSGTFPALSKIDTASQVCGKLAPISFGAPAKFEVFQLFFDMLTQPGNAAILPMLDVALGIPGAYAAGKNPRSGHESKRLYNTFWYATSMLRSRWTFDRLDAPEPAATNLDTHLCRDGFRNGVTWQGLAESGNLSDERIRLLLLAFFKSTMSVNIYARDVYNRKGTIATGVGCVHQKHYDLRAFFQGVEANADTIKVSRCPWDTADDRACQARR